PLVPRGPAASRPGARRERRRGRGAARARGRGAGVPLGAEALGLPVRAPGARRARRRSAEVARRSPAARSRAGADRARRGASGRAGADRGRRAVKAWCCGVVAAASVALGCKHEDSSAARSSAQKPWFEELAAERGLAFTHASGHAGPYWMPEIMGGGAALFDADGDGDLDACLVQSGRLAPGVEARCAHALFENAGGGRFRPASPMPETRGYGMGVAVGDVDEDGDPDLYVTHVGPNLLLENQGALLFTDATARAGVGHENW